MPFEKSNTAHLSKELTLNISLTEFLLFRAYPVISNGHGKAQSCTWINFSTMLKQKCNNFSLIKFLCPRHLPVVSEGFMAKIVWKQWNMIRTISPPLDSSRRRGGSFAKCTGVKSLREFMDIE